MIFDGLGEIFLKLTPKFIYLPNSTKKNFQSFWRYNICSFWGKNYFQNRDGEKTFVENLFIKIIIFFYQNN